MLDGADATSPRAERRKACRRPRHRSATAGPGGGAQPRGLAGPATTSSSSSMPTSSSTPYALGSSCGSASPTIARPRRRLRKLRRRPGRARLRSRSTRICSTTSCTARSAGTAVTFWTGCGAIRRRAFEAVDGFDECVPTAEHRGHRARHAAQRARAAWWSSTRRSAGKHLKRWTLAGLARQRHPRSSRPAGASSSSTAGGSRRRSTSTRRSRVPQRSSRSGWHSSCSRAGRWPPAARPASRCALVGAAMLQLDFFLFLTRHRGVAARSWRACRCICCITSTRSPRSRSSCWRRRGDGCVLVPQRRRSPDATPRHRRARRTHLHEDSFRPWPAWPTRTVVVGVDPDPAARAALRPERSPTLRDHRQRSMPCSTARSHRCGDRRRAARSRRPPLLARRRCPGVARVPRKARRSRPRRASLPWTRPAPRLPAGLLLSASSPRIRRRARAGRERSRRSVVALVRSVFATSSDRPVGWRADPRAGGGALRDLADARDRSRQVSLTGDELHTVSAEARVTHHDARRHGRDHRHVHPRGHARFGLRLAQGAADAARLEIVGDDGSIVVDRWSAPWATLRGPRRRRARSVATLEPGASASCDRRTSRSPGRPVGTEHPSSSRLPGVPRIGPRRATRMPRRSALSRGPLRWSRRRSRRPSSGTPCRPRVDRPTLGAWPVPAATVVVATALQRAAAGLAVVLVIRTYSVGGRRCPRGTAVRRTRGVLGSRCSEATAVSSASSRRSACARRRP